MLRFDSISKAFVGVQALQDVSFSVDAGSVHALCGENGAGKSTLLKVLSGVHTPDTGAVEIDGERFVFKSTYEAIAAGVAIIYQELNLVPEMSVAENIWLGHLAHRGPFVNRGEVAAKTRAALDLVGLKVDPWTKLGNLSLGQKQMVEIAKALSHDARIIAFDEPTSSLSAREVEQLFALIADLKRQGKAILYVSHRMDEVKRVCDACTVLRDGRHVETFPSLEGVGPETIINRMVGRDVLVSRGEARQIGEPVLEVRNVAGPGLAEPVSLTIRAGEIVGIFGLIGAGRTELLKAIYLGDEGEVLLNGQPVPRKGPRRSVEGGLVFCPEDRKKEGIVPMLSVAENLNLSIRRRLAQAGIWVAYGKERENTDRFIDKLRIKTPTHGTPISNLSGGNQQKVILARWLSEKVQAILLDEPTRGIDVGAKAEIYDIARSLAAQGIAVVFVSSELPEILALSDRVVVMSEGRVTGDMPCSEATEEKLLSLALPKPVVYA